MDRQNLHNKINAIVLQPERLLLLLLLSPQQTAEALLPSPKPLSLEHCTELLFRNRQPLRFRRPASWRRHIAVHDRRRRRPPRPAGVPARPRSATGRWTASGATHRPSKVHAHRQDHQWHRRSHDEDVGHTRRVRRRRAAHRLLLGRLGEERQRFDTCKHTGRETRVSGTHTYTRISKRWHYGELNEAKRLKKGKHERRKIVQREDRALRCTVVYIHRESGIGLTLRLGSIFVKKTVFFQNWKSTSWK